MARITPNPANDNDPAFVLGETVEVMTVGTVMEIITTPNGRDYLVRHTKDDGREIYIRTSEFNVYEHEPVEQVAA